MFKKFYSIKYDLNLLFCVFITIILFYWTTECLKLIENHTHSIKVNKSQLKRIYITYGMHKIIFYASFFTPFHFITTTTFIYSFTWIFTLQFSYIIKNVIPLFNVLLKIKHFLCNTEMRVTKQQKT